MVVAGVGYGMGSLRQMGSGFFPVVLGVLMALDRAALLATAGRAAAGAAAEPPAETAHLAGPLVQWRGWLCIIAGVLSFVVLGEHGGLVPASFVSVFIAALGDRANSVRAAARAGRGADRAGRGRLPLRAAPAAAAVHLVAARCTTA